MAKKKKQNVRNKTAAGKKSAKKRTAKPVKKAAAFKHERVTGRIDASGKGYGFVVRDDGGEDLFVPSHDMLSALGGDRVVAEIVSSNRGGGEAKVVEITERAHPTVVGTYYKTDSHGIVEPDNPKFGSDIFVKNDNAGGAKGGEKVVVKIIDYPLRHLPGGEITEVLGYLGEAGVDIKSVIREYGFCEKFPQKVIGECESVPDEVIPAAIKGRKDYRYDTVITIDGDDSRDFDDAVCVKKEGGLYELNVHIADVAHYVKPGSALDKEALNRATSVYFPDRVLPMLPEKLSCGICSLNEGADRLTLSVTMYIDEAGNIVRHEIREGVIRSVARMTYLGVDKILAGDSVLRSKYATVVPMLEKMKELSIILKRKRTERGNIEFDLPESKIVLDEFGTAVDVYKSPHLIAHSIIEEFMLACNETVAEHFNKLKVPFVYRAHAVPPPEKVQGLMTFVSALGLSFTGSIERPKSIDYARFLSGLPEDVSTVVNRVALRSMSKATYSPENIGHFGLGAPYYCHFTSPIRRYPDLMIHRIIKSVLNGDGAEKFAAVVEEVSRQSSERERAAESAERKVDDIKKAEYMRSKIGEEYDAIISGVTEWGIFAELENTCEGLIRTENLPEGEYAYNADLYRLDSHDHTFKLGDRIRIKVAKVAGDKVSFTLA